MIIGTRSRLHERLLALKKPIKVGQRLDHAQAELRPASSERTTYWRLLYFAIQRRWRFIPKAHQAACQPLVSLAVRTVWT